MTETVEEDIEEAMTAMVARHAVVIPPYPAVALKLGKLVRTGAYGIVDVVKLVAADATLSADLLRCANSAVYVRGVEVTSLQQAVARLGAHEVERLAMASALAEGTRARSPMSSLKRFAWQWDVASAILCEELAVLRALPREDAFLCGLLHDYGRLVALSCLDEIMNAMREIRARPADAWMAMVERLHVSLGLLLATRWRLPTLFQDVIALHHQPPSTWPAAHAALIDVVVTVDAVVRLMVELPAVDVAALEGVAGLDARERRRLAQVIPGIPSVVAAFEAEPRGNVRPSAVATPPTTLPDGFRRLDLSVRQEKPKRRGPFALRGIVPGAWAMVGKEAIGEHSLIEVTIEARPRPITLWAQVTRSVPQGGEFYMECKAFAANQATSEQLAELYRSAERPSERLRPG